MSHRDSHAPLGRSGSPAVPPACGLVRPLLDAYVDRELDRASADRVERHVDACAPCRALVLQQESLSAALKGWDDQQSARITTPSDRIQRMVLSQVGEIARQRQHASRWRRVHTLALAASVLLALGLGAWAGASFSSSFSTSHDADRSDASAIAAHETAPSVSRELDPVDLGVIALHPSGATLIRDRQALQPLQLPNERPARVSAPLEWSPSTRLALAELEAHRQRLAFEAMVGEPADWFRTSQDDVPRLMTLREHHRVAAEIMARRAKPAPFRDTTPDAPVVAATGVGLAQALFARMHALDADPAHAAEREQAFASASSSHSSSSSSSSSGGTSSSSGTLPEEGRVPSERAPSERAPAPVRPSPEMDPRVVSVRWLNRARVSSDLSSSEGERVDEVVAAMKRGHLSFEEGLEHDQAVIALVHGTAHPIYLPAGLILRGGVGDRVVAEPTWLPTAGTATHSHTVRLRAIGTSSFQAGDAIPAIRTSGALVGPTLRGLLAGHAEGAEWRTSLLAHWTAATGWSRDDEPAVWSVAGLFDNPAAEGLRVQQRVAMRRMRRAKTVLAGFSLVNDAGEVTSVEWLPLHGDAREPLMAALLTSSVLEQGLRARGLAAPSSALSWPALLTALHAERAGFKAPGGRKARRDELRLGRLSTADGFSVAAALRASDAIHVSAVAR